jgi:hypothetical protein
MTVSPSARRDRIARQCGAKPAPLKKSIKKRKRKRKIVQPVTGYFRVTDNCEREYKCQKTIAYLTDRCMGKMLPLLTTGVDPLNPGPGIGVGSTPEPSIWGTDSFNEPHHAKDEADPAAVR